VFDGSTQPTDALESKFGNDLRIVRVASEQGRDTDLLRDTDGLAMQRYDARAGASYLLRPDQHVAARWREPSTAHVRSALRCAQGIR
jgi:3-(3-hydroxy-phenyl)propionate hydroxylase